MQKYVDLSAGKKNIGQRLLKIGRYSFVNFCLGFPYMTKGKGKFRWLAYYTDNVVVGGSRLPFFFYKIETPKNTL